MSVEQFELKAPPTLESTQAIHAPEADVYGLNAIHYSEEDVATHMEVGVAGRVIVLPRVDVPPEDPKDTIFYLNISREHDPELFNAAADWFATKLIVERARVVVTPPSHKSFECIAEAVDRANFHMIEPIRLIGLVGAKEGELLPDADPDSIEHYVPITTPDGKIIGIKPSDRDFLMGLTSEELEGLFLLDDVDSTGKTRIAATNVIHKAIGEQVRVRTIVLAKEAPINTSFPPELDGDLIAAMVIAEVPGGIDSLKGVA